MSRDEVIAILGVLKVAYPNFYKQITKDELEQTVSLWSKMFANDNAKLVTAAVESLITSFQFPPTIADIKNAMYKLTNEDKTDIEYWNELNRAVCNCLYNTEQVYNNLSDPVKKFVGSPRALRDLALTDTSTFNTVTKGQFLKQIVILKEREKENRMMLPAVKTIAEKFRLEANDTF